MVLDSQDGTALVSALGDRTNGSTDPSEPRVLTMEVTPYVAAGWLEDNTSNRGLRPKHVDALARDIKEGRWVLNGETIKLAPDGTIVDGQHRLWAVVEADVPITTAVAFNVPLETQPTVDTGAKRTLGDVLRLRGEPDANNLASIVTLVVRWEAGTIERGVNDKVTHGVALERLDRDPEVFYRAVRLGVNTTQQLRPYRISASVLGACAYRFLRLDERDALTFFSLLGSGAGLEEDDPIFQLRKKVQLDTRSHLKPSTRVQHGLVIKAWNAWRDGAKMGQLRFAPGGATREGFPVLR